MQLKIVFSIDLKYIGIAASLNINDVVTDAADTLPHMQVCSFTFNFINLFQLYQLNRLVCRKIFS